MAQPAMHNPGGSAPYGAANAAQFTPPSSVNSANQTAEHFLSNYRLGKTLGIGSFGKVKIAEHVLTGHKVAIKILNRRKIQQMDMDEKARRELKILRLFMHPHIIRCYEVIETASDIYVVMEYVKSGELFDYIVEKGRLTEDEARRFFQQIISGVEYCHRNMVAHRDLKPENLLLDAKHNIKIADFGLSNVMRDGHFLKTSCGSPNYAAPEVISGKLYAGPEVDVWSCGVILYALLNGTLPFDDENIPNLFKKIKGGIYNMPQHLSAGARDLIPRMLVVDPLKRITIPEIRQHPWFTQRLPRYLAVMQADTMSGHPRIDEEMVNEVVRLGFDREELVNSLRNRVQNKSTVAYYLMLDNRKKMLSSGYLDAELNEATLLQPLQSHHSTGHPGAQDSHASHHLQHPSASSGPVAGPSHGAPQRVLVERRWRLGLYTRGHPSALMAELYRALQANSISWKKLSHYTLKCRTTIRFTPSRMQQKVAPMAEDSSDDSHHEIHLGSPCTIPQPMSPPMTPVGVDTLSSSGHSPTLPWARPDGRYDGGGGKVDDAGGDNGGSVSVEYVLRFEAQMYKIKEEEYVIDFQRLEGPLYLYMDVCCHILTSITSTASSYMLLPSR